jgi:hypothetical protein
MQERLFSRVSAMLKGNQLTSDITSTSSLAAATAVFEPRIIRFSMDVAGSRANASLTS